MARADGEDELLSWISTICPVLCGAPSVVAGKSAAEWLRLLVDADGVSAAAFSSFCGDGNAMCVHFDPDGVLPAEEGHTSCPFRISSEIRCIAGVATTAFSKRKTGALRVGGSVAAQVQVASLVATTSADFEDLDGSDRNSKRDEGGGDGSRLETDESAIRDGGDLLQSLHGYVRHVLRPAIQAADDTGGDAASLSSVKRKLAELEQALLHHQQNLEVPEVLLVADPEIAAVCERVDDVASMDLEDLGLATMIEDPEFLKRVESTVKSWIGDVQRVTRLQRDPSSGTAMQELTFWDDLDAALGRLDRRMKAPEVQLTLTVLRHAKRFLLPKRWESDTGLAEAISLTKGVVGLTRGFPLNKLLAAADVTQLAAAVGPVVHQLKKFKGTEYGHTRMPQLLLSLSRDICLKLVDVVEVVKLMNLSFGDFDATMAAAASVLQQWEAVTETFKSVFASMARSKRGISGNGKVVSASDIEAAFRPLQERMAEVRSTRVQHNRLRNVIVSVFPQDSVSKIAARGEHEEWDGASEGKHADMTTSIDALAELDRAYKAHFKLIDPLDLTDGGVLTWNNARTGYEAKVDVVERQITTLMQERLAVAKSADEMFRVFRTFNPLLYRPTIQGAIHQFQARLLASVREDIMALQDKFRRQYNASPAFKMARVRDLPPLAGSIIWARQIKRQLDTYLSRVESVLGSSWKHDIEGRELKEIGNTFMKKLDPKAKFEQWLVAMRKHDLTVAGRLFDVRRGATSESMELVVKFDPELITLFKEVRNLQWLGFRLPVTIVMASIDAQNAYPFAMSLEATLRSYFASCQQLTEGTRPLVAVAQHKVQKSIKRSLKREMSWQDDNLYKFSRGLAESVTTFQSQVTDVLSKDASISELLDSLKCCPYSQASFSAIIGQIQKAVDEMNLSNYSNLAEWVSHVDSRVSATLIQRLAEGVRLWAKRFVDCSTGVASATKRSRRGSIHGDAAVGSKDVVATFDSDGAMSHAMEPTHHTLVFRARTFYLDPPIHQARREWGQRLHDFMQAVLGLPRISATRYDDGLQTHSVRQVATFASLASHLPTDVLKTAYEAIEAQMRGMNAMVASWKRYEAMWHMDSGMVRETLAQDLLAWQSLLSDVAKARSSFDVGEREALFGPITVDYGYVQGKVINQYEGWHRQLLELFTEVLRTCMKDFFVAVSKHRQELESLRPDGDTAGVVTFVTLVQRLQTQQEQWKSMLGRLRSGQSLLRRQFGGLPDDWLDVDNLEGAWDAFSQILHRKTESMQERRAAISSQVLEEDKECQEKVASFLSSWDTSKPTSSNLLPSDALSSLGIIEKQLHDLQQQETALHKAKLALGLDTGGKRRLGVLIDEVGSFRDVWQAMRGIWESLHALGDTLWASLDVKKAKASLAQLLEEMRSLPSSMHSYDAFSGMQRRVKSHQQMHKHVSELKSDALKPRHWTQILRKLRLQGIAFSKLTLGHLWAANLPAHDHALADIMRAAAGEMVLEEFLGEVSEFWESFELDLANYRSRSMLVRGWDDLFDKLDEHLSSLASMKVSPHFKVFSDACLRWEVDLTSIRSTLDVWIDVQRRWVYLEGIFMGSADIKYQLRDQFRLFKSVDTEFIGLMQRVRTKPSLLDVMQLKGLQRTLESLAEMLEKVQKALGEYLERQRASFSRFYFVGDEDLLEVLGNSGDAVKVQRHLSKMFAGITSFELSSLPDASATSAGTIEGMASREGEIVTFDTPVDMAKHSKVNDWLSVSEREMQATLARQLETALRESERMESGGIVDDESFTAWAQRFPAQVVILASGVRWCTGVEKALSSESIAEGLDTELSRIGSTLTLLARRVLTHLPPEIRKKFEQLITELVHQRDVLRELLCHDSVSTEDFTWLYRMRHYWRPDAGPVTSHLEIRVANASFNYGFEYLGVGERLVQTPLTDRCYLTLTQALHLRLGGNPFGPAGTGKTESVKALGAQLGRFVLVFNCDETFDFQAMGRIFNGLCQVGAWGCFDEFNRLEERILSAVSQQILTIQTGLLEEKTEIELLDKRVRLSTNVGIFVTMNPGYAGRSNLPDNLKQLFRSIAMIKPDWELIAQVMLFSQGFVTAEGLAGKAVLLFSLCNDQLSSQPHYDFGLRALKSVLVSAGNLKRQALAETDVRAKTVLPSDTEAPSEGLSAQAELETLIRSINDTIAPKLVADDQPLFATLLSGVFPGIAILPVPAEKLRAKLSLLCEERKLSCESQWVDKTLQLFQIQQLSHGVMMVGPSGTGKTTVWRTLLDAMEVVDGIKGQAYVIDPKAVSKDELYGHLDRTTLEWTDGIFTSILRSILNNVRGERNRRHWIVFDGDVDPEWAENLNSVLDDNRLLTLPSGERLSIPPNLRIMFEVESLKFATLATVSRCGMVWFSNDIVTVQMQCEYKIRCLRACRIGVASDVVEGGETLAAHNQVQQQAVDMIEPYVLGSGSLVATTLAWSLEQPHIMHTSPVQLLNSLFSLLRQGVANILDYNASRPGFPMDHQHMEGYITKYLAFSLVWGLGGSMSLSNRIALGQHIALTTTLDLPTRKSEDDHLVDWEVSIESGTWRQWSESVPELEVDGDRVTSTDVVITTVDTVRHVEVLTAWLAEHKPVILCGPPGSGKTMTLTSTLQSMSHFDLASLNFSSATSPELVLKTFDQYCSYRRTPTGTVLSPSQAGKWLVVFCDEINLPENDPYGTQRVITFLRQLVEQNGFWKSSDRTWVTLERIQFVGACNPPTDAGRVVMSDRFLRHTPLLLVDFPGKPSLRQIYGTFNRGLLSMKPELRAHAPALTEAMVEFYSKNQARFLPDTHPHYIYSPRELSRWVRALFEAIVPLDTMTLDELARLWLHEGLRLFHDRLVTQDEREWCAQTASEVAMANFVGISPGCLDGPVLYSNWLSRYYVSVEQEALREHVEARLKVFYEEELDVPLVVFDGVLEHVLRIDRVLRQPLGHLLLVGESGAGKTVLSRFVAWMNNMAVFQIKVSRRYSVTDFDNDLRGVLRRAGCDGEAICFIFDESNVLSSAFLERMNALLASGDVPGLFEGDDRTSLLAYTKECLSTEGIVSSNEDELFRLFTKRVQRNLHVVFTMNPASSDFDSRAATSPALFNRCVVDWFGEWPGEALAQVGQEFTRGLDVDDAGYKCPHDAEALLAASQFTNTKLASLSYTRRDAVVAFLVHAHATVKRAVQTVGTRGGRRTYISPRDYLDFIKHFVDMFASKTQQLEDQQVHLNVGLSKLTETEEQVAQLKTSLNEKESELSEKNKQANLKLQQMVKDQNDAEKKKEVSERLSKELAESNVDIEERRKVVEDDLARAEPMLLEAQQSVRGIKRAHLDEIRHMASPPDPVKLTLEAVLTVLGEKVTSWTDIRRAIQQRDFIPTVVNFSTEKINRKSRLKVQKTFLSLDDFNYETVQRASKACGPLFKWVNSQVSFAEIIEKVQPMRDEVVKLQEQSADQIRQLEELKETIVELEQSIGVYKDEYALLIRESEAIKAEMEKVKEKVDRSTGLLANLAGERRRWESGTAQFESQMTTIVGDVALAGAFITYAGIFDFRQRRLLLADWQLLLEKLAIAHRGDLALIEYLSSSSDRLSWSENHLPSDDLCVENAIILSGFNRFPLVIDPSGQAVEFLSRHLARRQVTKTSFLDANFMKTLESALRFGMALIVQDVENIDPVLNPVLNREFHKTGGRTLVRLGDADVDLSPEFTMVLTTHDPSCSFTPDLCSRVTFVNFTVTPSSLENQCLSNILKSERPDIDKKRSDLLKLQGEFQARIRELEDSLLSKLSGIQGNILDDDKLMRSLELLKQEAADVEEKSSQTNDVMARVEAVTSLYRPLAAACSRVYFALESLGTVHFLYRFSLQFFLDTLRSVLEAGGEPAWTVVQPSEQSTAEDIEAAASAAAAALARSGLASVSEHKGAEDGVAAFPARSAGSMSEDEGHKRLERLTGGLFRAVFVRASRTLLHEHATVLALRLVQIRLSMRDWDGVMTELEETGELDMMLKGATGSPPKAALTDVASIFDTDASASVLSPECQRSIANLMSIPRPPWEALNASLRAERDSWQAYVDGSGDSGAHSAQPGATGRARSESTFETVGETIGLPSGWETRGCDAALTHIQQSALSAARRLLVVHAIRPDKTGDAIDSFVGAVFGSSFLTTPEVDIKQVVSSRQTSSHIIMLASEQGYDASSQVEKLANELRARCTSVAMGSAEGYDAADRAISTAAAKGTWVLLRNVHLCPTWLHSLEKKLRNMSTKAEFQLFLTCEIHPKLPANLLQMSEIITNQQPSGIKASVSRSLAVIDRSRMNKSPPERARLYFLLCWFHAVIQERLRYSPVGWTKKYEFSDADQACALDVIDAWVDEAAEGRSHISPDSIPWPALRSLLSQSIYGGRVDNEFDAQLLDGLLGQLFVPQAFDVDFPLVREWEHDDPASLVLVPEGTTSQQFSTWVSSLPTSNSPKWLGLPATAETRLRSEQGRRLINGWRSLQDVSDELAFDDDLVSQAMRTGLADGADATRPSWMRQLASSIEQWQERLPEEMPPLERDEESITMPLFRFIDRETSLAKATLALVRTQLAHVHQVCSGKEKSTNVIRAVMADLSKGAVPRDWQRQFKSAHAVVNHWISDLAARVAQLGGLAETGLSSIGPGGVWLGGFFSPEAFVTATRQQVAQAKSWPLDGMILELSLGVESDDLDDQSFVITGLVLEGASVQSAPGQPPNLALCDTIRTPLPDTVFRWVRPHDKRSTPDGLVEVSLPVYLDDRRADLMFTVSLFAPAKIATGVWRQRGVSLVAWSVDHMKK